MSFQSLTRHERWVTLILIGMVGAWLLPAIQQPPEYHDFADRRTLYGIANAGDVLSNIAFALAGLYGFFRLAVVRRALGPAVRTSLYVFFAGLVLTALGSGYYHLDPNNATLVLDRLPMIVAFAGVLGAVVGERVSGRAGFATLAAMFTIGLASVIYWKYTDNVLPYAVVQFGGIAAVVLILTTTARGAEALPWWSLIVWYGLAKLVEAGDEAIWHASGALVAGHLLKHLAAAMGGVVIAHALGRPAPSPAPAAEVPPSASPGAGSA